MIKLSISKKKFSCRNLFGFGLTLILLTIGGLPSQVNGAQASSSINRFSHLIEANIGQFATEAKFLLRSPNGMTWFSKDSIWITTFENQDMDNMKTINLHGTQIRLGFPGSNPGVVLEPISTKPSQVSYLKGTAPSEWHTMVPTYDGIRYRELYPGVNLVIHSESMRNIQYPWFFEVRKSADLSSIRLRIEGSPLITITSDQLQFITEYSNFILPLPYMVALEGEPEELMVSSTPMIELLNDTPQIYEVISPFTMEVSSQIDVQQPLSESLFFSTYLGGSEWDIAFDMTVDEYGAAYVTGRTPSLDFPITSGTFSTSVNNVDVFVAKMNQDGSGLEYATYIGGVGQDSASGIAVEDGYAYLVGDTWSQDFPMTDGLSGENDVFILKLNPSGTALNFVTLLGGSDQDYGNAIAVGNDEAFITGSTLSPDFTTTDYQGQGDVFVAKLDSVGNVGYISLLGGRAEDAGYGIAVKDGEAYVTGATWSLDFPSPGFLGNGDLFVAKFGTTGGSIYTSLVGGIGEDRGTDIIVDNQGNSIITGWTGSPDFPGERIGIGGGVDAIMASLNPSGTLASVIKFGGTRDDQGQGIALGGDGSVFIGGHTTSTNLPVTAGAYQRTLKGGTDVFLAHIEMGAQYTLMETTYLGGTKDDRLYSMALDSVGNIYLAGSTDSGDYPVTENVLGTSLSGSQDAFVTRFGANILPTPPPSPTPTSTMTSGPPTETPSPTTIPESLSPTSTESPQDEISVADETEQPPGEGDATLKLTTEAGRGEDDQITPTVETISVSPVESTDVVTVDEQPVIQITPDAVQLDSAPDDGSITLWIILPIIVVVLGIGGWLIFIWKSKR